MGGAALLSALLSGCVTRPGGPVIVVFPGAGKTFDQYRADDRACRQTAQEPGEAAGQDAADPGRRDLTAIVDRQDSVIGATGGLLVSRATGSRPGDVRTGAGQPRRDGPYLRCMYGKGNLVPAPASMPYPPPPRGVQPAPPPDFYPLPPPDFAGPPAPG